LRTEPPRARLFEAHFRRQVTLETFGVAMYMPPPPESCPDAAAGAASTAHEIKKARLRTGHRPVLAQGTPRFAGRRVSRNSYGLSSFLGLRG
jgi:hypothetical protein